MTFGKRVVLFIDVQKFEQAQIGEGVRWFTLVSGADFRRDDRCFIGFYSEAFCFSPAQEDMIDLLNDCVGCRSKV